MNFCSHCGQGLQAGHSWPVTCGACGQTHFKNPLPVVVVLVPVGTGVLTVRRAIEPGRGKLALPGGYLDWQETWQEGGVREVREETGLILDPGGLRLRAVHSAGSTLLVFADSTPVGSVPEFSGNPECSGLEVVQGPCELAFPLHSRVLGEYFAARGTHDPS